MTLLEDAKNDALAVLPELDSCRRKRAPFLCVRNDENGVDADSGRGAASISTGDGNPPSEAI